MCEQCVCVCMSCVCDKNFYLQHYQSQCQNVKSVCNNWLLLNKRPAKSCQKQSLFFVSIQGQELTSLTA